MTQAWLSEVEAQYVEIKHADTETQRERVETVRKRWGAEAAERLTAKLAKAKPKPKPWPDAPTAPPGATRLEAMTYARGLLGHMTQYMVDTSPLPDRTMALAGAVTVGGKALDRRVLGPTGNSTVLYNLMLAETGAGKQPIINCIQMLLKALELDRTIVASGLASVQAIEEVIEGKGETILGQPNALVLIDEVGSWLSRVTHKSQTGNVSEIPGLLQTLWGWPLELEWKGTKKVGKEMHKTYAVAFSIFGASTERAFFRALHVKDLASGFVNRMLLWNVGRGAAHRVKPKYEWTQLPTWLGNALNKVVGGMEEAPTSTPMLMKLGDRVIKDFHRIGWGTSADEIWATFEDEIRNMPSVDDREIWIRAPEIAVRLATIVAVFRGSDVVDVDDIRWGIEVVQHSTKQLMRGLSKHMLDELEQADLVELIREKFRQFGTMTVGAIRKLCERRTNDHRKIDQAIEHLEKSGDIALLDQSTGPGRPTTRWKWTG
jgi:hypothetical protein